MIQAIIRRQSQRLHKKGPGRVSLHLLDYSIYLGALRGCNFGCLVTEFLRRLTPSLLLGSGNVAERGLLLVDLLVDSQDRNLSIRHVSRSIEPRCKSMTISFLWHRAWLAVTCQASSTPLGLPWWVNIFIVKGGACGVGHRDRMRKSSSWLAASGSMSLGYLQAELPDPAGLESQIGLIREASLNSELRVLVGGHFFVQDPALASAVGADATAIDGHHAFLQIAKMIAVG